MTELEKHLKYNWFKDIRTKDKLERIDKNQIISE